MTLEWSTMDNLYLFDNDYDGQLSVSVDECPLCAAIVRTTNRERHEAVCWGV